MKNKNSMKQSLAIFQKFNRVYLESEEKWYFSVVDIVAALIDQRNYQLARKYWNKLAERLKKEGGQLVTKCHRFKMIKVNAFC
jgi:DNA-damage-inducible protein D